MNYTYGYIKDATLVKLDMSADQAIDIGLLNKFSVYANEAMTQICSAVKPKYTYVTFKVRDKQKILQEIKHKYKVEDLSFLSTSTCQVEDLTDTQKSIYYEYNSFVFLNCLQKMPSDFISFGGDVTIRIDVFGKRFNANDNDYNYKGYNQLIFFNEGDYIISYNARWFLFVPTTDDTEILDVPADIIDCIPTYIASQCYKIDDEAKASIMRNEFEIAVSRIDNTHFEKNGTITISGGW